MLLLQYDPSTTELIFRESFVPPVTASFSEFTLTTNLTLEAGTVLVDGVMDVTDDGTLQIAVNSIIEVL